MIGNADGASGRRGSRRGVWTIVGIFVLGGIFVGGLYFAARRGVPEEYRAATVGTPARTLRFVSMDLGYDREKHHLVIDRIYKLNADFLLLQRVTRKDAYELALAMEMRHGGRVQMFYSLNDPATAEQPGNAVLAKWPLYQGRTMAKGHPRQFGVFVESIVEGRRFLIGCWDLAVEPEAAAREASLMIEAWRRVGEPPLVIGGVQSGIAGPQVLPEGMQQISEGAQAVWGTSQWTMRGVEEVVESSHPEALIAVDVGGR